MCGRYTLFASPEEVARIFDVPSAEARRVLEDGPRYNVAPTTNVAAVRTSENDAGREAVSLRWGLVPHWVKEPKSGPLLINARGETVAEKPAFRASLRSRRCLVIADGFFEWQKLLDRKQPHIFQVDNGALFAFAGIWDRWERGEEGGGTVESCAIITTRANELAKLVHERMPVILSRESWDIWLREVQYDRTQQHTLRSLLSPFPAERMSVVPVSTLVNSARNDTPECLEPVGPVLKVGDSP
jgi:putative SOS response-associated peptidase YedK